MLTQGFVKMTNRHCCINGCLIEFICIRTGICVHRHKPRKNIVMMANTRLIIIAVMFVINRCTCTLPPFKPADSRTYKTACFIPGYTADIGSETISNRTLHGIFITKIRWIVWNGEIQRNAKCIVVRITNKASDLIKSFHDLFVRKSILLKHIIIALIIHEKNVDGWLHGDRYIRFSNACRSDAETGDYHCKGESNDRGCELFHNKLL